MNSSAKKVKNSLTGIGATFDVSQYRKNADSVDTTTESRPKSNPPQNSTSTVIRKHETEVKSSRAGQGSQPKEVSADDAIPDTIASGQSPITPSGKRRVGVSRKYNNDVVKTTIVIPTAVHDVLAEIIFRNRKTSKESLNDLVMQGLDTLLQDYGLEPIDQIVSKSSNQK